MARDRFLIAPFESGLVTSAKPWMIPEDAFAKLKNAFVYRGRVSKRPGSRYTGFSAASQTEQPLHSRLRVLLGNTDPVTGIITGTVPGSIFEIGQQFSVGDRIFTVYQTGFPATMHSTWLLGQLETRTYDTANGQYNISAGYLNTPCYWYPAQPVMGFHNYEEGEPNEHVTYAFDTQFAYKFNNTTGAWERSGTEIWHSTNSQFFHTVTWAGEVNDDFVMFVTNFRATLGVPDPTDDPMYTYNGTLWAEFKPRKKLAAGLIPDLYVKTARIILPFKQRLLLFNTIEDNSNGAANVSYVNRCRFSRIDNPLPAADAWIEGFQPNGLATGGFVDAPTKEAIIGAQFIKDRVIVYFERSTWELVYVYNFEVPFVWQKINSELGSTAQFSAVRFDKAVLTAGQSGIYACSGTNVTRIDQKVEDQASQFRIKNNGLKRIHGVRDLDNELVYWTYPEVGAPDTANVFNNKLLLYNYQNKTWAELDDCVTTLGTFEGTTTRTWFLNIDLWIHVWRIWRQGEEQQSYRRVIAGNQHGFVFLVDRNQAKNAAVMQITHAIALGLPPNNSIVTMTIINHTLVTGDYIKIENLPGIILAGDGIYQVRVFTSDTFTFFTGGLSIGIYLGGGWASRVSRVDILSKQWNFYNNIAVNVAIPKIDFCVGRTTAGAITVDYLSSSNDLSLHDEATATGAVLGDNVLETSAYAADPLEAGQVRLWHPVYFQAEGNVVQIRMYFTDDQMIDPDVSEAAFELEAIVVHAQKVGSRFE